MFELQDYFTLDDLRLPPIRSSYVASVPVEVSNFLSGPRYENKPFALPKVDKGQQHVRQVPKTYTTRKGALLLYAEDFCLPGSPKPRKKRHKVKKPTALKLRTMNDLRNHILDYKNGVCYINYLRSPFDGSGPFCLLSGTSSCLSDLYYLFYTSKLHKVCPICLHSNLLFSEKSCLQLTNSFCHFDQA